MKTVLKGFTGDGREILFLPVFAKPNSLLQHSSAEVGLSVQLSQRPNVPQHGQPTLLQSHPILLVLFSYVHVLLQVYLFLSLP